MRCSLADSSTGSRGALWHPRQIVGHLTIQAWRNSVEKLANLLIDFTLGSVFPSSYGSQAKHKLSAFARSMPTGVEERRAHRWRLNFRILWRESYGIGC